MDNSKITEVDILDEARDCFLTYAEEVLTDRAIPAAEDGLLSAQRKILWTMEDYLKMNSKSKTKKCNGIVGSTLQTSYFHGDLSCYGVLCKMSQEYLMRYPLIAGQGSLGTQENNDMISSSRYTEAKPSIYADLMMLDYKKNVAPTKETYNGEYMEPVILPSLFPNSICNGRQAIGISMAHSTPSHNLTEVCNALIALIQKGDLTLDEILDYIKGPDLPLGNVILNSQDVREAFRTGKSKVSLKVRGDYEINGQNIIFTTIPYRTYRNKIREQIEANVDVLDEVIEDFNDESSIGQNRLIFTIKKGIPPETVLNKLFSLTDLQTSISYNMNYIVNGTPKLCSMLDLLNAYVEHQEKVLIKATKYDKEKAEARAHILRGLIAASNKIDEVITLIKSAENKTEAKNELINFLTIDEVQAKAILDMKLGKLTRIDKNELVDELKEKEEIISQCILILENKDERNKQLIARITWLRDKYGDERRTKLLNIDISKQKLEKEKIEVIPEDCVVVITESNSIKRIPTKSFRTQKRNSVGVKNGDDIIKYTVKTNTLDTLMVFTSHGKMYRMPISNIPEGTNVSRGTAIKTLLTKMADNEIPMAYSSLKHNTSAKFVFFATKGGMVKRVPLDEYRNTKKSTGIIALSLREGDSLAAVTFIEDEEILLVSKRGMCIRFASKDMPISSRTAKGVKGIALKEGDEVLTCLPIHKKTDNLAIVAVVGIGKQISLTEFTTQNRGGRGLICYKEEVANATLIDETDSLLLSGDKSSLKINANDLPLLNRTAQGNILLKNNNKIVSVVKI